MASINQIVTEAVNNLPVTYETIVKATYEDELLQNVIKKILFYKP